MSKKTLSKKIKAILFDVDGVLLDADEALFRVRRSALEKFGFAIPSRREILRWSGLSSKPWLSRLAPRATARQLHAMAVYSTRVYRRDFMKRYAKPAPGVRETLATLARRGIALGIVSNQTRGQIKVACEIIGCAPFSVIVSRNDAPPKPSSAGLRKACRALRVTPSEVLYVGDSETDVQACAAAGVRLVVVDLPRNRGVRALRGVQRIKHLRELLKLVKNVFKPLAPKILAPKIFVPNFPAKTARFAGGTQKFS